MKRSKAVLAGALLLAAGAAALETTEVELREGAENDGTVTITRSGGSLVFTDAEAGPLTLAELSMLAGSHAALSGLGEDDHPHYLDGARHLLAHDAGFNGLLAIPDDVAGNTTLGAHLVDSVIHLNGSHGEAVTGAWSFTGGAAVGPGPLRITGATDTDPRAILFEDAPSDASFGYNPATARFEADRSVHAAVLSGSALSAAAATVTGTLSGKTGSVRTGVISGFTSIEGIAHADLLSRTADEDISAQWDFLRPTAVSWTETGTEAAARSLGAAMTATLDSAGALTDRERAAVVAETALTATGAGAKAGTLAAGAIGRAEVTGATVSAAEGLAAGLWGEAESAADTFAAAGVAGIAPDGGGSGPRIGVLGGLTRGTVVDPVNLRPGAYAGVFLGDVHADGAVAAACVAVWAANGGASGIEAGDAVAWIGAGEVDLAPAAATAAGAVAGIALEDAGPSERLRVAVAGLARVKTGAALAAGNGVEWDGSEAVAAGTGSRAPLGTAAEDAAGGSPALVLIQVQASYRP